MGAGRGDFAAVESALRRRSFGTLSTLGEQGRPHATGVVYAVSPPAAPLALYVTTRSSTRKVQNVRAHADVAFVVPVPRRFLPIFPPSAIQFLGTAEVLSHDDHMAVSAFGSSWFLRRILAEEQRIVAEGGDLCFIRICPDPTVFTYGIGMSPLSILRRPRSAIGRIAIPPDRL